MMLLLWHQLHPPSTTPKMLLVILLLRAGAQADDNDVEIVGSPLLVIEERPQEKRKSNDGCDGQ
jgi:hypothetical protein